MSKLYLVRHGERADSTGERRYIGVTDVPLSERGQWEAERLADYFSELYGTSKANPAIYTSPLKRCSATAGAISGAFNGIKPTEVYGLHEIDLGEWEGKTVKEIRERFPEEYEKRGRDIGSYRITGGESFGECAERFSHAVTEILEREEKADAIIVAHAGVIRAYLALLSGGSMDDIWDIPLPYASVTILEYNGKSPEIESIGRRPLNMLDESGINALYSKYRAPENVIRHMRKVAEACVEICDGLNDNKSLNRELIYKSALLHDLLRLKKNHAEKSAEALIKEGYPDIAALVEKHHDGEYGEDKEKAPLTDEELLFYADKIVSEDRVVSIEERFSKSREKCKSAEALAAHKRMYDKSLKIGEKIKAASRKN